jgi:hypothetical protein
VVYGLVLRVSRHLGLNSLDDSRIDGSLVLEVCQTGLGVDEGLSGLDKEA